MGNSQCTSPNHQKISFEILESKLQNPSNIIEKNILSEYSRIKKALYQKRQFPKSNINYEKCSVSLKIKNISSFRTLDKQKSILLKWLKISTKSLENNNIPVLEQLEMNLISYKNKQREKFLDLVANGSPESIRYLLWMFIADIPLHECDSIYDGMLNENIDPKSKDQIKKDLHRTYFHNEEPTEEQLHDLYNLLKLFSLQDKEIGYCQGMNFIAKFILKVTSYNTTNAFYLMTFVFSHISGYFQNDFPLLSLNLYIFNLFFQKYLPKLNKHFITLEIPSEIWIGKWFQTLFTICLPFEETCRVWDALFAYGFDFIIPFSLSLLKQIEIDLLKLTDSSDVVEYLKECLFPQNTVDVYKNQESQIISVDKIITEATKYYNKHIITNIKKDYEIKFNKNVDLLLKNYDMNLIIKTRKTFSSSQSSTDFSLSKKDGIIINNNISHSEKKCKLPFLKEDNNIVISNGDDLNDEVDDNCDECLNGELMNTNTLCFHIMDINDNAITSERRKINFDDYD